MSQKVILITGASSGIGLDTARMLASKGCKVYGAARRVELMEPLKDLGVVPLYIDLTDTASMQKCVNTILEAEGRIDALVNNAGYGQLGPIECVPIEDARKQMEVNVFGIAQLCSMVIPAMRAAHSGRIVNLSSIAGKAVVYFGGWYNVSKFSVEALSDALRIELKPFGIDVAKIEPGGIRTPWGIIAAKHLEECTRGSAYQKAASDEAAIFNKAYSSKNLLSSPKRVAGAICRACLSRRPKACYRVGVGSGLMPAMHSLLPARWWDSLARLFAYSKSAVR